MTLYIEAIRPSVTAGDLGITLLLASSSCGKLTTQGTVCVTAVQDTVPDYDSDCLIGEAQGADGGDPMSNAYTARSAFPTAS